MNKDVYIMKPAFVHLIKNLLTYNTANLNDSLFVALLSDAWILARTIQCSSLNAHITHAVALNAINTV